VIKFLRFCWLCTTKAFWRNTQFANDWQWMFGIPIVSGLLAWIASRKGVGIADLTTGNLILDVFAIAFAAFIVTWMVAFCARLIYMPATLYYEEKARVDGLYRERHQEEVLYEISMLRAQVAKQRIAMERDVNSSKDWEPEFEALRAKIADKIREYSNDAEAEIFTTAGNLRDRPIAGTKHDLYIAFCIRDLDYLENFIKDHSRRHAGSGIVLMN
jgi:hypothetical protein